MMNQRNKIQRIDCSIYAPVISRVLIPYCQIASNAQERAEGYQNHIIVNIDEGILFPFEKIGIYPMHMRNVQMPLLMIWLNGDRVVDKTIAIPSERLFAPKFPANLCLECHPSLDRFVQKNFCLKVIPYAIT